MSIFSNVFIKNDTPYLYSLVYIYIYTNKCYYIYRGEFMKFFNNKKFFLPVTVILLFLLIIIFTIKFNSKGVNNVSEKFTTAFNINKTNNPDFYDKLKNKQNINILVIGDSIGESDGVDAKKAWYTKLSNWFNTEYNIKPTIKLLTHPGGGVLNGLSEYTKKNASGYDLIIVCYGQNDRSMDINTWSVLYETLLRRALTYNSKAEVIPLVESSFQNYDSIPNQIKQISNYYNLQFIDVRIAFKESGIAYNKLAPDGTHGNETGYSLYFKAVSNLIKENCNNNKNIKHELKSNMYAN